MNQQTVHKLIDYFLYFYGTLLATICIIGGIAIYQEIIPNPFSLELLTLIVLSLVAYWGIQFWFGIAKKPWKGNHKDE